MTFITNSFFVHEIYTTRVDRNQQQTKILIINKIINKIKKKINRKRNILLPKRKILEKKLNTDKHEDMR